MAVLAQFQRCPGVWKCTDASRHQHLLCHDCQRPGNLHFLSPVQQEEGETVNGEQKILFFWPRLTPGLLLSPSAFFPFSVVSSFCLPPTLIHTFNVSYTFCRYVCFSSSFSPTLPFPLSLLLLVLPPPPHTHTHTHTTLGSCPECHTGGRSSCRCNGRHGHTAVGSSCHRSSCRPHFCLWLQVPFSKSPQQACTVSGRLELQLNLCQGCIVLLKIGHLFKRGIFFPPLSFFYL